MIVRRTLDLVAVLILGAGALLALLLWPSLVALRAGMGLPFMLLGVGYVGTSAIYGPDQPDGPGTLVLALSLSIVTIILVALGLYVTSVAFTGRSVLTAELGVTAVLAVLAMLRRVRGGYGGLKPAWPGRAGLTLAVSCLIPAAVFAGLIVSLSRPLPNRHVAGYSALWAVRGAGSSIIVGVGNSQLKPTTYRIEVIPAKGPITTSSVTLRPGEQSTQSIAIERPSRQPVIVRLYRSANPTRAYRQVTLQA